MENGCYPDEMYIEQEERQKLKNHKDAFAYLNNIEENKFSKLIPQRTKDAYNLIADFCMNEYQQKYGNISGDEYMRFLVSDYSATAEGRTLCFLCSPFMPYASDYNPVNSKEYRAVREFHSHFGSWYLYGIQFLPREVFFEKYGKYLPSALVELKDKSCYLNYFSQLHFNFS